MNGLTSTPAQRWLARLSFALAGLAIVILLVVAGLKSLAMVAVGLAAAVVSLAAAYVFLSRRGIWRWLSLAVFVLAPIAVIIVYAFRDLLWVAVLSAAVWLVAGVTARRALAGPWGQLTGFGRAALMRRLGDLIARDADRLAEIETRDTGKLLREMRGQLGSIPEWFYYFSGLADKLVQNWKISVLLRSLAPRALQDIWFPRYMADPQFLMAHCLTEPRGASDRWLPYNVPEANMDTTAVHADGHWIIDGRKQFISNGYDASLYVVYANTDRSAGMLQGTSSFLVPRDTPGLQVTRCNETIGGRFMNNGEIVFEDCRVPEDHLLAHGDALGQAGVYFRPGKIIQAAKNLGIGIAAFDDTAAFVQQRVQGGRILIKHQAVAVRVAAMATKLEAVSTLLRYAALAVDENSPDATRLCDMVKVFASQEILQVCQHAVELHGGYGAMLEVGVEKYFRDAAVYLHMDATVDVSNFKIAKALFPGTAGAYAGPE